MEEDAPTIVITAHYDSFGLVPVSCIKIQLKKKKQRVLRTSIWKHLIHY